MDFKSLKEWWDKLGITIPQTVGFAILIFIFGLILLSFTFIVPILAIGAALFLIAAVVYIVYKFLGGK